MEGGSEVEWIGEKKSERGREKAMHDGRLWGEWSGKNMGRDRENTLHGRSLYDGVGRAESKIVGTRRMEGGSWGDTRREE